MTPFSEAAWQRTARLRQAIDALPFNTELAAGTLSRERFQGYIVQDALYLGAVFAHTGDRRRARDPMRKRCARSAHARLRLWPSSRHCMNAT